MRLRIAAMIAALAILLFPLGAAMIVSQSFDLSMTHARERALSEEAAIARALVMELASATKDTLFTSASSLQMRYGSSTLQVILLYNGQPMANTQIPPVAGMEELLATGSRATLLDRDTRTLYIAHRLSETITLLVATDVSQIYRFREELTVWAGALSLLGVLLSTLLAVVVSNWLARSYQQLARQRQELLDAMAHEMRTPLTAIVGGLALLERTDLEAAQRQKLLDTMSREAKRLTDMDERLLQLIKIDRHAATFTRFSSMDMAREALSVFENVTLCGEDMPFEAERELMITLLRNLVVNAQRAGGEQNVCVQMRGDGFSVQDWGCGMTAEQIAHAFEPFYRADKSRARSQGGAGLGLTLCERIARLHGGSLRIDSEPGKGTVVTYTQGARIGN